MSPVQHLREFIRERLTAAAEEIFTEVEKTIIRYEEENRLMENYWKPQKKLQRIEPQKPHEVEALAIQHLFNQGRRSRQDQEELVPQWTEEDQMEPENSSPIKELGEPGPPWIKEEDDPELPLIKEENEEPETKWAAEEQKEPGLQLMEKRNEPEPHWNRKEKEKAESPLFELKRKPDCSLQKHEVCLLEHSAPRQDQEEKQPVQKQSVTFMETFTFQEVDLSESEPRIDQLLFHIAPVVETRDQKESSSTMSQSRFQNYTKRGSLNCDICGRSFKRRYNMKRHYTSHTGEKPFLCQTCGKGFSTMGSLEYHIRTHTGERPFPCQICKKGFSSMSNLKDHIRTHTGERPFSCGTCGKRFSKVYNLNVHIKTHKG
ncbi:PREDICTED: zinc finger protein 691-like [Cyprinodon variegatus]|uniref:Zinc finger protein 691-like n=1 Tax=Cyprinodon variegatus TaxID=28743 RepID=A0A3Q2D731_CYPVA|nr:PREDICTED: zinc finger protein 691-like [Cyprinodon variegatus]